MRSWLNPGAKVVICLRFAFIGQIAVEDNGIRRVPKTSGFQVDSAGTWVMLPGRLS